MRETGNVVTRREQRRTTLPTVAFGLVAIAFLAGGFAVFAQGIDLDEANAREEFRFGVQAYHATRFDDAIVALNRALAFTPGDMLIREWLGRAYFYAGLEDAALSEWQLVVDQEAAGAYLVSLLETLRYRRGILPFTPEPLSLSRSQTIESVQGELRWFQRPSGLAANRFGDVYAVSLGTQEVLRLSANGFIRGRLQGGIPGLDQPFDVALHDDEVFVSEFGGDRVGVLNLGGNKLRSFGESGLEPGQLLGPQYIAIDEAGFVYVTEWGNRRVSKFTTAGRFLLTIGAPSELFDGLRHPTGIATRDGLVYVADSDDEGPAIQVFDDSGNHIRRIPLPLESDDAAADSISGNVVEDLTWYDDDRLLVAAGRQVLVFEPENEAVVTSIADGERARVASAVPDANGRVFVSDFDADEIGVFEPDGVLYSGLDVRIERIIAREFPVVSVLVAVHDREGDPVVGLIDTNFTLSEMGFVREDITLESAGQRVERVDTIAVLQPRAGEAFREDAGRAVEDLAGLLDAGDSLAVFVAGETPQRVISGPASPERYAIETRGALQGRERLFVQDRVRLDSAIRRAGSELLQRDLRRHVVVVGDGRTADAAFAEIGIDETAAFLANNGIHLHVVMLEQRSPGRELQFLVNETGGTVRYLYEPEGLAPLVRHLRRSHSGRYWLSVQSRQNPDFGRRYIELSVEARLFVRTGRDELGFFPPSDP